MAKKIRIEIDFEIQDKVYLLTDPDLLERVITSITLLPGGLAVYHVACGETETDHYYFELASTKPVE